MADGRSNFAWRRMTALILFQLILGAAMRHQHAGLAIPDFPLAYGRLWPATDPESVARYNEQRVEVVAANPIRAFQIDLQMAHRIVAALILVGVGLCAWRVRRVRGPLGVIDFVWFGLVVVQAVLGAATVWSNKAADIATAHVLVGALSLATGVLSCIVCSRSPRVCPRSGDYVARRWRRFRGPLDRGGACGGTVLMKATTEFLSEAAGTDKGWLAVYADLVKARLTFLVLLTTLVGFYLGCRGPVNYLLMLHTLLGTALVGGRRLGVEPVDRARL